ncbi:hypothetical protein CLAIMM_14725, partial [Cladophialophora immunda]
SAGCPICWFAHISLARILASGAPPDPFKPPGIPPLPPDRPDPQSNTHTKPTPAVANSSLRKTLSPSEAIRRQLNVLTQQVALGRFNPTLQHCFRVRQLETNPLSMTDMLNERESKADEMDMHLLIRLRRILMFFGHRTVESSLSEPINSTRLRRALVLPAFGCADNFQDTSVLGLGPWMCVKLGRSFRHLAEASTMQFLAS